jgi:hypothetical protein
MTYGLDGGNMPGCNGAVQVEQLYTGRWRAEHRQSLAIRSNFSLWNLTSRFLDQSSRCT